MSTAASVHDSRATLSSNSSATPIVVSQDRGYREGYARTDIAGHRGQHDWKAGMDAVFNPVHETLSYSVTDPSQFDPATLAHFTFLRHEVWDLDQPLYVQDAMYYCKW